MGGKRRSNRKPQGAGGAASGVPGSSSTPNPKQEGGPTQAERLERYRAALERGQPNDLPAATAFDDLLASPVKAKGKDSKSNYNGEIPTVISAANAGGGESEMDSAESDADAKSSSPGGPVVPGASGSGGGAGGGKPGNGPAADGVVPKGRWKGKFWSSMTQEERQAALAERKAERQAKIDERDQTQAEWVRRIHPVVRDDDPEGFQRILKTMGIDEGRIRQTGALYGKLLDGNQRVLALLLWCQARDTKNELIRYLTGQIAHSVDAEDGSEVAYEPDLAMNDSSMKVRILQLLVKLGRTLTRREAEAQHKAKAEALAEKQARWAKNPSSANYKGGKRKGEGGASATSAPTAAKQAKQQQQQPGPSKKSPSTAPQPTPARGEKRLLNDSSLILESETESKRADLQNSSEKRKQSTLKQIIDKADKMSIADNNTTSNHTSSDKEVQEEGGVKASYAEALNNPFRNPMTIKIVRLVVDDDGKKVKELPGMSKEHFEGKFLPELEQQRRRVNLERIRSKESTFKAARACTFVKGKPNSQGEAQPNHGLIVPFDDENSMWLMLTTEHLQLQQGTEGKVYRYAATKAFEAGKGTILLSFKVSKLGSDVSADSWELFCHDNAIDSSQTKQLEPKHYQTSGEIEVVFAATRTLVQKLRAADVSNGRLGGHVVFGMQGNKQLLHKTKPLMSKSMEDLEFLFGKI